VENENGTSYFYGKPHRKEEEDFKKKNIVTNIREIEQLTETLKEKV
jgi:hypothetical protein